MRILRLAVSAVLVLAFANPPSLSHCEEQGSPGSDDRCSKARSDYLSAEQSWADVNAEVTVMRQELERTRALRWETKTTLSVIEDARDIIENNGRLSDAQSLTLNARIPAGRGRINPDGTFTVTGLERSPLKLEEALKIMHQVMRDSDDEISRMERELLDKEKKSHSLIVRLTALEETVEEECRAAGIPTPWEQGMPRTSSGDIYQRYVEREQMREEAVESRRYADIERLWAKGYRPHQWRHPSTGLGAARALLIELKGVSGAKRCLHCYPYSSPWEKRWILDELERAAREHERFPTVGHLGSFEVIRTYPDIVECYDRIFY